MARSSTRVEGSPWEGASAKFGVQVAGAKIFLGGTIGEGGHLAMEESLKGVPIDDEDEIAGVIAGLMKEHFGARDRAAARALQEA